MLCSSGLYKVATGEKIADAAKPGMFDLKVRPPLCSLRGTR